MIFKRGFILGFSVSFVSVSCSLIIMRLIEIFFTGSWNAIFFSVFLIPFSIGTYPTEKVTGLLFAGTGTHNHPYIHYLVGMIVVGIIVGVLFTFSVYLKGLIIRFLLKK